MTKQLSNLRKAIPGVDDATLTRWVKEPTRHQKKRAPILAAVSASGTQFKTRVLPVAAMTQILVSGHSNVKIGRDVRKGALKGYWIYTLSLEERATCPSSCAHWRDCYGNNMPFAKRVDHTDPAFLPTLDAEITRLASVRGRAGLLIRLHALGDFYHPAYVDFWREQLRKHPNLALFGYTAHPWASTIGQRLQLMRDEFDARAMIRYSDGGMSTMSTMSVDDPAVRLPDTFTCPEQTGKTQCCATCALCWSTTKNVAFISH